MSCFFRLGSEEVCTSSKYVCVTCVFDHVTVGGHTYQLYETADLNISPLTLSVPWGHLQTTSYILPSTLATF